MYSLSEGFGLKPYTGSRIENTIIGGIIGAIGGAIACPFVYYIKKDYLINRSKAKMLNITSWVVVLCFYLGMLFLSITIKDNKTLAQTTPNVNEADRNLSKREEELMVSVKINDIRIIYNISDNEVQSTL